MVQLLLLSWTTHATVKGFEQEKPWRTGRLLVLLAVGVPTLLLTGFVAVLLGYHTYLVSLGAWACCLLLANMVRSVSPCTGFDCTNDA